MKNIFRLRKVVLNQEERSVTGTMDNLFLSIIIGLGVALLGWVITFAFIAVAGESEFFVHLVWYSYLCCIIVIFARREKK